MAWWWPFKAKKEEAVRAEREFRESLAQALLQQGDLQAATESLKESRKPKRDTEEIPVEVPKPRARNA